MRRAAVEVNVVVAVLCLVFVDSRGGGEIGGLDADVVRFLAERG